MLALIKACFHVYLQANLKAVLCDIFTKLTDGGGDDYIVQSSNGFLLTVVHGSKLKKLAADDVFEVPDSKKTCIEAVPKVKPEGHQCVYVDMLGGMMESYQGMLLNLEEKLSSKDEEIAELQRRLAAKNAIIETVVRQKDAAVAELGTYSSQLAKDERELNTIEDAAFSQVQAALRLSDTRIAELEKTIAQLKASNSRLQSTSDKLKNVLNKRN
eukprot:14357-Heterococcus_DN1.PRE.4